MTDGIWPVYVSPGVQSPFPNWAMYRRMAGAVVPALSQGFWGQRGLPMSLWGLIFSTGGRRTGWIRLWKWLDWNDIVLHYCYYVWGIAIKIKQINIGKKSQNPRALRRDRTGIGFDIVLAR